MQKYSILACLLAGFLGGMQGVKGGDFTWQNGGVGNWDEGGNWGGSVPGISDTALVANSGTANVGTGVEATAATLDIEAGEVSITGGSLTLDGVISIGASGSLSMFNGTASAANISGSSGGSVQLHGGTLRANGSTTNYLTGLSSVVFESNSVILDSNGYDLASETVLSGTGGFTKTGYGALTLTGENTYSGPTVLNQGALRIGGFSALGTGPVTINSGTLGNAIPGEMAGLDTNLLVNNDFTIDAQGREMGAVEIFGNVDMGADSLRTITLTGEGLACFGGSITAQNLTLVSTGTFSQAMFCSDTENAISGTVRVGSGVQLELWKINTIAISGNLLIDAGAQVHLLFFEQFAETSDVEINGLLLGQTSGTNSFDALSGTGTLSADVTGETFVIRSGTFAGTVTDGDGTVALIKQGPGTLALSGSNSHSAGTTIGDGTLRAENDHALGSGSVSVESNGTLHVEENVILQTGTITLQTDGSATYRKAFAINEDLSHFNALHSDGSRPTTAQILAGMAGEPREVTASFSESPDVPVTNDQYRISDVFSLSGTDGDLFVMQLSFTQEAYEAAVLAGLIDSKLDLYLGILEEDAWTKLEDGFFVDGAWNSSYMTLGTFGVDRDNNTVWAVTNREGGISVVPEPTTWLLFGLGFGLLVARWKKRS